MKHKIIFRFWFIILLCSGMVTGIPGADARQMGENINISDEKTEQDKALQQSLELLKKLPPKFKEVIGFKPQQMNKELKTLTSLKWDVFIVGLDSLDNLSNNPETIMRKVHERIYPVSAGGELVTSITLRKRNGKWEFAVFGELVREFMDSAFKVHDRSRSLPPLTSYFIVKVPAMYRTYFGYHLKGKPYIIVEDKLPAIPFPERAIPSTLPAETVFKELKKEAKIYRYILEKPDNK
jgi:hypothetical protein